MDRNEIIHISIKDYLEGMGVTTRKEGSRYFCSSPFSRDSNWSFCIYPTNTYFDFSTGKGGNILNLVASLSGVSIADAAKQLREGIRHEKFKAIYKKERTQPEPLKPFDYKKYINTNPEECAQIKAYASSRGIEEGYFCGVFFTRGQSKGGHVKFIPWIRVPALGFLHVDKDLKPCGIKLRRIDKGEPRFSARGSLGFYILSTETETVNFKSPVLYVVESESSANSLWMYLKKQNMESVILSRGGVSSVSLLEMLPTTLVGLSKKLIIDYDGNEELYQQRLKLYEGLGAQPIRLILPKGEDINSLYMKNEMWKIEQLLL